MMQYFKYVIDGVPPSNNEYMGNSNSFRKYGKEKEKWHWLIKAAIKHKPTKPLLKAIVSITYFFEVNRRRDPDNYSGKFILDPLVKEGIIADDSFKVIDLRIKQGGVDKNNPRTEIEVMELENI